MINLMESDGHAPQSDNGCDTITGNSKLAEESYESELGNDERKSMDRVIASRPGEASMSNQATAQQDSVSEIDLHNTTERHTYISKCVDEGTSIEKAVMVGQKEAENTNESSNGNSVGVTRGIELIEATSQPIDNIDQGPNSTPNLQDAHTYSEQIPSSTTSSSVRGLDSARNKQTPATDRDLLLRMNKTNDANRRENRRRIATQQTAFALRLYPFTLLWMLLITIPFYAPIVTHFHTEDNYIRVCRPEFAMYVTLIVVCGILHLTVAVLYLTQIYKYRGHQLIKTRGKYFLNQLCIVVPFLVIIGFLATLSYTGTLTGDCLYTHNMNWQDSNAPIENGWSATSVLVLTIVNNTASILGLMSLSAIIARQYLLYKLFVDNKGGARVYTTREIKRIYLLPNAIVMSVFLLETVIYWVTFFISGSKSNEFITSEVRSYLVLYEFILALGINIPFTWLSYKTRDVEIEFNDWWANIRTFVLTTALTIIIFSLRTFSRYNIDAGILHGPFFVFLITMYVLDAFSGPLILIISEDKDAPRILREGCSRIVRLIGTGPLWSDEGRRDTNSSAELQSSVELDSDK